MVSRATHHIVLQTSVVNWRYGRIFAGQAAQACCSAVIFVKERAENQDIAQNIAPAITRL